MMMFVSCCFLISALWIETVRAGQISLFTIIGFPVVCFTVLVILGMIGGIPGKS